MTCSHDDEDRAPIEILLVEDNPEDAELTMRALRGKHLVNVIQWVTDGEEALDFLFARGAYAGRGGQRAPRVVFLDLKLPKVDGIEVLRQLREDDRTKAIPVVVLTSSAEERDIARCYALAANSFVTKPVDFRQFERVVDELGLYWIVLNRVPIQPTIPD